MADAENQNPTTNPDALGQTAERLNEMSKNMQDVSNRLSEITNSLDKISEKEMSRLAKGAKESKKAMDSATISVQKYASIVQEAADGMDILKSKDPSKGLFGKISEIKTEVAGAFQDLIKSSDQFAGKLGSAGKILKSLGTIKFAGEYTKFIKKIGDLTGYNKVQKELYEIQKQATQIGVSFGQSYMTAQDGAKLLKNQLVDSIKTANMTKEAYLEITGGLSKFAFTAHEANKVIENLKSGSGELASKVTLTNTAFLVAAATGMKHADTAKLMETAQLELGKKFDNTNDRLKDNIKMWGHIKDAAKDSGLSFEMAGNSIVKSAQNMKYFGSRIESVAPLFKSFSDGLKGTGREGLTPELLDSFTQGLASMTLGTKAFLSQAAPGMRGTGLLGGALKMEQAMETGEGMGDIAKSITETLKQYGGPQILTRQEAIDSPSAQRNYIIQRQMLGQLVGIKDAGKQELLMRALQNMDRNGMKASADTERTLHNLLSSGEKLQKDNTTDMERGHRLVEAAVLSKGDDIIKEVKTQFGKLGVDKINARIDAFLTRASVSGDVSFGDIMKELDVRRRDEDKAPSHTGRGMAPRRKLSTIDRIIQKGAIKQRAKEGASETITNLKKQIAIKTMSPERAERVAKEKLKERRIEINRDLRDRGLPKEKRAELKAEKIELSKQFEEMLKEIRSGRLHDKKQALPQQEATGDLPDHINRIIQRNRRALEGPQIPAPERELIELDRDRQTITQPPPPPLPPPPPPESLGVETTKGAEQTLNIKLDLPDEIITAGNFNRVIELDKEVRKIIVEVA
jgi:hypothetical protein